MDIDNLHKITYFGELKNPLYYCEVTGTLFRHQRTSGATLGFKPLGHPLPGGYIGFKAPNGKTMGVHQLVACEFYDHHLCGHKQVVNHKDGNPANNRKNNIEVCTPRYNAAHCKLNAKMYKLPSNITYCKDTDKYIVQFKINNKNIHFGRYDSVESSIIARDEVNERVIKNGEPLDQFKSPLITAKKFRP